MHEHTRKISVHRGSDVGLYGHGIFSKTNVKYATTSSSTKNVRSRKSKKRGRGVVKLSGSGPRHGIKKRRKRKSVHSRAPRSKDTLF
jgi:hypothetical protein